MDLGPETMFVVEDAHLTSFDPATEEEIRKIIMSSALQILLPGHGANIQ